MSTSEQDRQQIAELIEHYRHGFAPLNIDKHKYIWDQDDHQIIYVAQKMARPIQSWAGVASYYQRIGQLFDRVKTMEISHASIDVFGDIGYVFLSFHFESEVQGQAHLVDGRESFLLKRKNGVWKVIHYHESRPGEHQN